MNKLSFNLDSKKDFSFSHKNDFSDLPTNEIHYLFNNAELLFWVVVTDGEVVSVAETERSELDGWENAEDVTDEQYQTHVNDAAILSQPEYLERLQVIIDKI